MSSDSISPIDGRYRQEADPLGAYFSERALNLWRARVELAYLRLLVQLGVAPKLEVPDVEPSLEEVTKLEAELGHDVKALEVHLRGRLEEEGKRPLAPYVHLGLTSEDTNSMAFALTLKSALADVLIPAYSALATDLASIARREAGTVMVARTHGRPAVPTTFGREMAVFAVRVAERTSLLRPLRPMAKLSGAVGTFASFELMGRRDWRRLLAEFVQSLGVDPAVYSTQVVPGERLSDILHLVINLNQLTISLCRDLWLYQTLDYVRFLRPGKVSSSTMPQKVNPVDLENAEGQAELSNSLLTLLAYRMEVTRMQRDLSDSVLRRMVGQGLAHSLVANLRLRKSLASMAIETRAMAQDLASHPEVYAEREQILARLRGDPRGYEKVKKSVERGKFTPSGRPEGGYLGESAALAREAPGVVKRLLKPSS